MIRAVGLAAACVAFLTTSVEAQVSICGHSSDGGSSSCSPINSGQLFIAIAPFTFFPIIILWALSCWCCLKENDIEVGECIPTGCCSRRYTPPSSTSSTAPLYGSANEGPVIGSPVPYSGAATNSSTPASTTNNPEAVGIQMSPPAASTAATSAAATTVVGVEARRTNSLTAADDSAEENEPTAQPTGAAQRPGSGGAAARRGRGGNARSRSPAAGGDRKAAAAAAAAFARQRAEAAKAEKESVATEASTAAPAAAAGSGGSGSASGPGGEWDSGVWECPTCTAHNPKSAAARCSVCEAKRPAVLTRRAGAGPSV